MTSTRHLDWDRAVVSPGRICVPLDGGPDDYWLDRFHQARTESNLARARDRLPRLQIELRDGEISASDIAEGDDQSVRTLLGALVEAANRRPKSVDRRAW